MKQTRKSGTGRAGKGVRDALTAQETGTKGMAVAEAGRSDRSRPEGLGRSAVKRAKHPVRHYVFHRVPDTHNASPTWADFGYTLSPSGTSAQALEDDSAALEARVAKIVRVSIKEMDAEARRRAIASPTPAGTIAEVVRATPDVGLPGESAHARALARGAALKQRLLLRAGGALTSGQVATILGITPQGVKSRVERGKLLAVPVSGGKWGFPARQFDGNDVRPGVVEAVTEARSRSMGTWYLLSLLMETVPGYDTTLEALADTRIRAGFIARLRTYGEHQAS